MCLSPVHTVLALSPATLGWLDSANQATGTFEGKSWQLNSKNVLSKCHHVLKETMWFSAGAEVFVSGCAFERYISEPVPCISVLSVPAVSR